MAEDFGKSFQEKMNSMFRFSTHEGTNIKKIIGVVSGKGGVGKSLVTGLSALASSRQGLSTAIMDADITGPSIPKMFGLKEQLMAMDEAIVPAKTKGGIKVVSTNLILDNPDEPVVWRGPILTGIVEQFYKDVLWEDVDIMFIDMPPGTGDVPLTVFQSIPMDGIIVVTSPQDLVSMIVGKALNMAESMNIPVLGVVENMSYVICPDCGEKIRIFGPSHLEQIAEKYGVPILAKLPIDPALAPLCDGGKIEEYEDDILTSFSDSLMAALEK